MTEEDYAKLSDEIVEVATDHRPLPDDQIWKMLIAAAVMHINLEKQDEYGPMPMVPVPICRLVSILEEIVERRRGRGARIEEGDWHGARHFPGGSGHDDDGGKGV